MKQFLHILYKRAFHLLRWCYRFFLLKIYLSFKVALLKKRVRKKFTAGKKINVIFLVQFPEMWNSEKTVFFELMRNELFNPLIVCVPKYTLLHDKWGYKFYKTNEAYQYFKSNGYEAIDSSRDCEWVDLKSLCPDYIFIQRPYSDQLPKKYQFKSLFKFCLLCYIPYGVDISSDFHKNIVFNDNLLKYCSLFFSDSDANKQYFDEHKFTREQICFVTGHPRLDYFVNRSCKKQKVFSKTILWLPRWYIGQNGNNESSFFKNIEFLLDYLKENRDCKLIIRPHPLMFNYFINHNIWTKEDYHNFEKRIKIMGNVELDKENDYLISFETSDILISDYTSLLLEYFATGKPILYCGENDAFNEYGNKMAQTFYKMRNIDDLKKALDKLILENIDELKEKRDCVIKDMFNFDQTAASRIMNIIVNNSCK